MKYIKRIVYFRLGEVLELTYDLAIDIPKIWTYLAEILCKYISVINCMRVTMVRKTIFMMT